MSREISEMETIQGQNPGSAPGEAVEARRATGVPPGADGPLSRGSGGA